MKKGDKIKCIKDTGFERILEVGKFYTAYCLDEKKVDIGLDRDFPIEFFVEADKHDFTEERDELSDIFWSKDMEIWELEDKIAEINYLQKYWGDKLEDKLKELKILKMAFEIWYDNTIEEAVHKFTAGMNDKDKKEFLKNYSAQAKERRLITMIPEYSEQYEQKQKDIIELEYEIGKFKMTLKSLETKAINLAIINKNHKETIN
ncbi:MAG: hypothetical protein NC222_06485 [Staphylococcus sp.]|nr:hypothetical protein [Staphylococcus sp.]